MLRKVLSKKSIVNYWDSAQITVFAFIVVGRPCGNFCQMVDFSQNGLNEFLIDALNLELRVLWGSS